MSCRYNQGLWPVHHPPECRIHLFETNRYFYSGPDNPFEHSDLDWASGRIGCVLSSTLESYPEYQFSVIGTVEVLKPECEKGLIAVLMDNEKLQAQGLELFNLLSGAQRIFDRDTSSQTLHNLHANYLNRSES